jgi:hypothetical protein
MTASDMRLILNDALFKRASKRLQRQWPATLTLTQAQHTLAQTLGFEDYAHLQRVLPASAAVVAHDAHVCAHALRDMVTRLIPWVSKEGGALVQWIDDLPQIAVRGQRVTLDLGVSQTECLKALDTLAGGVWDRIRPLSCLQGDLQVTFRFRTLPVPALLVSAVSTSAATSPLGVISDDSGLHALIRTHQTGFLLHLGPSDSGKSFAMHASTLDWTQRGQPVGLYDPYAAEPDEGYVPGAKIQTEGAFPKSLSPSRWVIGGMEKSGADLHSIREIRKLREYHTEMKAVTLPLRSRASWVDTLHGWVQAQVMSGNPQQVLTDAEFNQACRWAFHDLHGVIIHGALDAFGIQRETLRTGGYLTTHELTTLTQIPQAEWHPQAVNLARSFGHSPAYDQQLFRIRNKLF